MSASTGAAVKAYLEGPGMNLGISVYRDAPPQGTTLFNPATGLATPYCTVAEGLGLVSDGLQDGADVTGTETVQLDLWQPWRDSSDKPLESKTLPDLISRKLGGARLLTAPTTVYGVLVRNRIRLVERGDNIVHHAYTLALKRAI